MKKSRMKIIIPIMLCIIVLIYGVLVFVNSKEKTTLVSKNITQPYTVELKPNNCTITKENNSTKIKKYNGNAETLIIDSNTLDCEAIEIDIDAFLECTNLDTILIDKSLANENIVIDNFEPDNTYISDKYIKYISTKPYSEAYMQYLALSEEEKSKIEAIPNKYSVPINAIYTESMEENYNVSQIASEQISESFDLRDYIDIKVENQQSTGICYAFASLNSVETNLALIDNVNVDLSEVHAASLITGYGGNFISDTELYYADKIGPVYEENWPIANLFATNKDSTSTAIYNYLSGATSSLSSTIKSKLKETEATKYVTETVNFPEISKSSSEYNSEEAEIVRKIIKKHIMQYGSLYANISSNALTSQNGYAVLNTPSSSYQVNHAISIVGWDDNFSKENFPASCKPVNNGAYLALNSWGENWGNAGYFWISYEDYWVESGISGVISVDGNINLTSMVITNADTNKEIPTEIIPKGINANIEINTIVDTADEQLFGINIISPSGEDVTSLVSILENKIENKNGKITLKVDTSALEVGKYKINITYGDETFTIVIEIVEEIIQGEGWYYVPEEAKLYITENYQDRTYDYLKYNIHKVELEEPIDNILAYQFWGYSNLEEVTLPASLKTIETAAFYGCKALKDITIPEGVTSIGKESFYECTNLKTVTMLAEIVSVGDYAFFNCTNLDTINISKGIANTGYAAFVGSAISEIKIAEGNIGKYAFNCCTNLKKVEILDDVTGIGYGAFYECTLLETVDLGKMTGTIDDYAFMYDSNLKNINIPSGVTSIGYAAFAICGLENVIVDGGAIGKQAFAQNDRLQYLKIGSNVTSIGYASFGRCPVLTNVNIEEGVTSFGDYAFERCTALKNINLPTSLSAIGYGAFCYCTSLINLEIPESVKTIGDFAFYQSTTYIDIENGTISREKLPNIIKRPTTTGDILNCNGSFIITNSTFNKDYSELVIDEGAEKVEMAILNGKLRGLTIIANVEYRTITYSEEDWTTNDVVATLNIKEGDTITNNNGQNTYTFTENGEFEFQYTDAKGVQGTKIAKVENIDKDKPEVKITGIPTEYTDESVTLVIEATDNLSGLAELPYSFDGGKTWQEINTKTYEDNISGIIIQVRDILGNTYIHEEINITQIRRLNGIKVTTLPIKTEYIAHENFDEQGMIVELIYDNSTSEQTVNYTILNGKDLTCQVPKIIIQYNEDITMKTKVEISVAHDMINATCTEEGNCKIEGCTYTEEAKGHNYESEVTAPTCTEKGYTTHTCTRCDDSYVDTETEALDHSFTSYVSNEDATCLEDGTKTAKCDRCDETHTIADEESKLSHSYENGKCTGCGQEEPEITITSEKYNISEQYITEIADKKTVKEFKESISTNAGEVKILDKDNQELVEEDSIGTGMTLVLKSQTETKEFKLVVLGDVTGDGKADFKDIVLINRYRLHKTTLESEYIMAGEVTGDNEVDFKDIVKINRYRLHKITQLLEKIKIL